MSSPKKRARPPDPTLIADRLHSAAIQLLRTVRRVDEASGLGPARLSALSVVVFGGPLTLGSLAAAEQVKPPTMSRIVGALVRAGLIRREADQADRRSIRLRATPKGARLMRDARRRRVAALAEAVGRLRREDLARLGEAVGLLEGLFDRRA
jgi:DNA-binding MarR family transcriptional regulator